MSTREATDAEGNPITKGSDSSEEEYPTRDVDGREPMEEDNLEKDPSE